MSHDVVEDPLLHGGIGRTGSQDLFQVAVERPVEQGAADGMTEPAQHLAGGEVGEPERHQQRGPGPGGRAR